jgi:glycosyltransferase involved in cell wall biosynthesis
MATVITPNNVDYQSQASRPNTFRRHVEHSSVELKMVSARRPAVLVAIPCFNEEIAIGSILLRTFKYTDRVVVIDDGSTDRTAEIARAAGVEVIVHEKNEGKGASIRDAFNYARTTGAEILVLIDGDGQHDPAEIPSMIAPIINGEADMVNGSRFLEKGKNNVPKYRRVGQEVLTMATNAGGKCCVTDSQNGFRAFSKNTFNCFSFKQNGMAIESEMLMDAVKADLDIKEVQINVRYDVAGSTYNPVTHGLGVLNSIISLTSQRRPLLFFSLPGVLMLAIGVIAALVVMNIFVQTRNVSILYSMISMVCIIVGMLSVFTGMTLASIQSIKANAS